MTRFLTWLTPVVIITAGYYQLERLVLTPENAVSPNAPDQAAAPAPAQAELTDPEEVARQHRITKAYLSFAHFSNMLLYDLFKERYSLAEASDRIFLYSVAHYPEYLVQVDYAEAGASLREKVARNLLDKLSGQLDHPSVPENYGTARLAHLREEFRDQYQTQMASEGETLSVARSE